MFRLDEYFWTESFHLLRLLCHLFLIIIIHSLSCWFFSLSLCVCFFLLLLLCVVLLIFVSPHWTREFMICWIYQSTAFSSSSSFMNFLRFVFFITFNYSLYLFFVNGALLRCCIFVSRHMYRFMVRVTAIARYILHLLHDKLMSHRNWYRMKLNAINDEIAILW